MTRFWNNLNQDRYAQSQQIGAAKLFKSFVAKKKTNKQTKRKNKKTKGPKQDNQNLLWSLVNYRQCTYIIYVCTLKIIIFNTLF